MAPYNPAGSCFSQVDYLGKHCIICVQPGYLDRPPLAGCGIASKSISFNVAVRKEVTRLLLEVFFKF